MSHTCLGGFKRSISNKFEFQIFNRRSRSQLRSAKQGYEKAKGGVKKQLPNMHKTIEAAVRRGLRIFS